MGQGEVCGCGARWVSLGKLHETMGLVVGECESAASWSGHVQCAVCHHLQQGLQLLALAQPAVPVQQTVTAAA